MHCLDPYLKSHRWKQLVSLSAEKHCAFDFSYTLIGRSTLGATSQDHIVGKFSNPEEALHDGAQRHGIRNEFIYDRSHHRGQQYVEILFVFQDAQSMRFWGHQ